MAMITRRGKKAYADDRPLRDMNAKELDENLVFYLSKTDNLFAYKGKFWLWFVDAPGYAAKLNAGEYDLLTFPILHRSNMFNVSPINDVWKRSRKRLGSEHVIGIVEGFYDEDKKTIRIEMMSVRPTFKRNRVNTLMIDAIVDALPGAELLFEDPTDDGYVFMKSYGQGQAVWTGTYRPKSWVADHPEDGSNLRIR